MTSAADDRWRPVRTDDGSWTLEQTELGEACHSHAGAWTESVERYALPCRLRDRAQGGSLSHLRLLDVGCGLGLNLAAACVALEGTGVALEATTLEIDPDVIRATLALGAAHPDALSDDLARSAHAAVCAALASALERDGEWIEMGRFGRVRLLLGDARVRLPELDAGIRFDAVFQDAFSPRRAPELWTAEFLRHVARRMASGSILSTYSAAFGVRLALAQAGLGVGLGPRVGSKAEGTLASPDVELAPLPERIMGRLRAELDGPGA